MNVAFPLRDGYFPPLQATPEDHARWTQRVREHVIQSLEDERPYFLSGYEDIDRRAWKLVRCKDQLRVFRPRRESAEAGANRLPCLLEIGTIEGTLEDVIYGVHNATTPDMRTTTSFLSADALDAAVLAVFENGCDDDLFRSFALKWRILETPAGSLVKNRDVLALEYMGISRDAHGERFAFHICDSFDHPVCPPFHPQCSVRAKTNTRIIYRQLRPGRVGVYYRAEYTTGGRIPKLLARWTAAEVAVSIGRSVECAEAKKLTQLALAAHGCDENKRAVQLRACAICDHQLARKALHSCDVCGAHVCTRCRSRKYLLSDEGKVPVGCCKQCIVAAKGMCVDARKPLAILSAAYWHGYGAIVSATAPPPASGAHRNVFDRAHEATSTTTRSTTTARTSSAADEGAWFAAEQDADRGHTKVVDRRSEWKHAMDRRQTREDVYELLAAMSSTSESTVESVASRDDASTLTGGSFLDVDDDDSPRVDSRRKASLVAAVDGVSPPPPVVDAGSDTLWHQMKQLRVAAEQTYRITKQTSDNWVR